MISLLTFCKLVSVVLLLGIAYEDFKQRLVRVVLYILLMILLIVNRFYYKTFVVEKFVSIGLNMVYIILLLTGSFFFLLFRDKSLKVKLGEYLGIGDVLFWISLGCWFDSIPFVIFNTVSLAGVFILHFLLSRFQFYRKHDSIPLAGMQSIFFLPVFLLS